MQQQQRLLIQIAFTCLQENDFENPDLDVPIDFRFASQELDMKETRFKLFCATDKAKKLPINGDYTLKMLGDFNESKIGTAAIIGAGLAGLNHDQCAKGIRNVTIPGRMQTERTKEHGMVVVDYAHNKGFDDGFDEIHAK